MLIRTRCVVRFSFTASRPGSTLAIIMNEPMGKGSDPPLGFKVPQSMREAIKKASKREGITVGEWLRRLVRAALGGSL